MPQLALTYSVDAFKLPTSGIAQIAIDQLLLPKLLY